MENRRLLIAVILSWVVILVWYGLLFPPQRPTPTGEPEPLPGETTPAQDGQQLAGPAPAPPAPAAEAVAELVPVEHVEAAAEERLLLETDSWVAEFTNRGAQLVSLRLKQHLEGGQPLQLVHPWAEGPRTYALVGPAGASLPINDALFVSELKQEPGGQHLSFRYAGPLGQVEKRFDCSPEGLCEVEVAVAGRADWAVLLGPGLRQPTAVELKNSRFRWGVVYDLEDDREFLNAKKTWRTELSGTDLRWVALDDTYFLNAVIPWEGVGRVVVEPFLVNRQEGEADRFVVLPAENQLTPAQEEQDRELALLVAPREDRLRFGNYWGAKDYGRLAALPYGLEETVDFGWFPFLARPLQLGLSWIHDQLTQNYGWAIVLMTLVIRIVLLPLTHRSIVHAQQMQKLSPKMQAIRSRYRGKMRDKQGRPNAEAQRKMNEEVMGLYREAGVNPVSGCFPVLLQFPVFLAFYYLLSGAVELRNAPWVLWIHDLAVPDPYYVLPLVMGGSQFVQQLMMPIGADPMQRRLFLLMPVFLTFLFLNFASGLVLYWLTSNVIGIVQQAIYRRLHPEDAPPAKA